MKKNIHVGFDIDETFIHSIDISLDQEPYIDADFNIKDVDTGRYAFSTYIRPNASLLLNYVKDNYNIFFYTRSSKDYALAVLKEFGLENEKFFSTKYIDVETVDTLYEGRKRFKVKRLDKIASKLNIDIDDMMFIDDIRNTNEIRPIHVVTQVPAYHGSDNDNIMTVLLKKFQACNQLDEESIKAYFKSVDLMNDDKIIKKTKFKM
jgi:hypothetical protein